MQDGNKVLKGLGDRLIEEENEGVKCSQCVILPNVGLQLHT